MLSAPPDNIYLVGIIVAALIGATSSTIAVILTARAAATRDTTARASEFAEREAVRKEELATKLEEQKQREEVAALARDAALRVREVKIQTAEAAGLVRDVAETLRNSTRDNAEVSARIEATGKQTHIIVNNQRTIMLRLLADLADRIARDNPNDPTAQEQARLLREQADAAGDLVAVPPMPTPPPTA